MRGLLLIISITVSYMSNRVLRWKVSRTKFIVSLKILFMRSVLLALELYGVVVVITTTPLDLRKSLIFLLPQSAVALSDTIL